MINDHLTWSPELFGLNTEQMSWSKIYTPFIRQELMENSARAQTNSLSWSSDHLRYESVINSYSCSDDQPLFDLITWAFFQWKHNVREEIGERWKFRWSRVDHLNFTNLYSMMNCLIIRRWSDDQPPPSPWSSERAARSRQPSFFAEETRTIYRLPGMQKHLICSWPFGQ